MHFMISELSQHLFILQKKPFHDAQVLLYPNTVEPFEYIYIWATWPYVSENNWIVEDRHM